ncbi:MAG: recombinase family protein (plasmid) [Leptolyngbya sp. BL-A-14]
MVAIAKGCQKTDIKCYALPPLAAVFAIGLAGVSKKCPWLIGCWHENPHSPYPRRALSLCFQLTRDTDNQLLQRRECCERQGWQFDKTDKDEESSRKGKRGRGGFSQLFKDASERQFDLVLLWSLDRFTREGMRKTIATES